MHVEGLQVCLARGGCSASRESDTYYLIGFLPGFTHSMCVKMLRASYFYYLRSSG